ncbi:DUF308 domain-containing protein [Flavisphingomonas formosensis]|uniref:DUF308 domain-containing protein n=1 Tax=Flavisphingomonas formosensis TaxID=861534 RepID=UPI0012F93F21|nr:DUF308 domain-containing protein [Sphingomonas formosensis]
MTHPHQHRAAAADKGWLKSYYAVRALFSLLWVALAFTIGRNVPAIGTGLLLLYPAWDSLANLYDARRSGGLRANPSQAVNMVASALVTLAIAAALIATRDLHAAIGVIGLWAILAGLLQLATALRRRGGVGAQWPMMLSGAQSCLAGGHFAKMAADASAHPGVADVAPYAAFGAFYFAISAAVLAWRARRD